MLGGTDVRIGSQGADMHVRPCCRSNFYRTGCIVPWYGMTSPAVMSASMVIV
jgi:hypothetical protein